jgi:dihydrodipicolinate synthase/N-acetylneuraminate lyase
MPGVYVPTLCFFDPTTEDLDPGTIRAHAIRLARAGVRGLTTQGSNGEAVHLDREERRAVTSYTRDALVSAGYDHLPILVGCGAQSVRETIENCKDAQESGGDYALVLPPSYYAPLFKSSSVTILEFYRSVATHSPIPIIIYNYPGAAAGIDLSSDTIIELSKHQNIVGVKLTCGNTGKLNRIVAAARSDIAQTLEQPPPFLVLGGSADFALQTLVGGGHGILAGLANIAPKSCVAILNRYNQGNIAEAQRLQEIVARGDWVAIQGGVVGTKAGLQGFFGYGGFGRTPLPRPSNGEILEWKAKFLELWALEKSL